METESSTTFRAAICPHCQESLEGIPALARYCPRCGKVIGAFPAVAASAPIPPTADERTDAAISMALIGYSNAMFRLGWRYEHGHGVFRNEDEASRCYTKSAKLGNVQALTRLEEKPDSPGVPEPEPADDQSGASPASS